MKLFHRKSETALLAERLKTQGLEVVEENITVGKRDRRPANVQKITVLKAFLDIIDEDDVDRYFLEMLTLAEILEYKLQGPPVNLLAQIEREHSPQKVRGPK